MKKADRTHLYCFDDHRGFTEDIKKKFTDTSRYSVLSFPTKEEFLNQLQKEKESKFCKISILGLHENKEQYEIIDHLTFAIKKADPETGIILICPTDRIEDIRKVLKFNIDAYIIQNSNAILRIHNTVKKLISEHNIGIFRKRRNFSLLMLLAFVILSSLFLLFAFFRLPGYF